MLEKTEGAMKNGQNKVACKIEHKSQNRE